MRTRFHDAAREVTASCFPVDTGSLYFLVDSGSVQGGSEALKKNHFADDFDCALDFMLLTHANIDHSRLIPHQAHEGFRECVREQRWRTELVRRRQRVET